MEIYKLSDNARIKIGYDYDQQFWDVIGNSIGIVLFNTDGLTEFTPYDRTAPLDARDFISSDYIFSYNEKRLKAYAKYLSLNGSSVSAVDFRGYSQGEWATGLVYVNGADDGETVLNHVMPSVKSWYRGDVYTLTAQTKKTYTADDGETVELWNDLETVGGYVLEYGNLDQETAENFAAECGLVATLEN